jgi:hypothetical protein
MITDLRRTRLNLAQTLERVRVRCRGTLGIFADRLREAQLEIERLTQQVARVFWDIKLSASPANSYRRGGHYHRRSQERAR